MDIKTIAVPLDFGAPSRKALGYARAFAEQFGASLHLLHVVSVPWVAGAFAATPSDVPVEEPAGAMVQELIDDANRQLREALPEAEIRAFGVRTFVQVGDPREVILEHAARERIDLIVMGTHGRTGTAHLLLGSVTERVVREAPCPVLTVREAKSEAHAEETGAR